MKVIFNLIFLHSKLVIIKTNNFGQIQLIQTGLLKNHQANFFSLNNNFLPFSQPIESFICCNEKFFSVLRNFNSLYSEQQISKCNSECRLQFIHKIVFTFVNYLKITKQLQSRVNFIKMNQRFLKSITKVMGNKFSTQKNPYTILGIKSTATQQQIKKAYLSYAQKYHPDKNPDKIARQLFVQAKQAYETLIDQDKRRQFDNQNISSDKRNYSYGKNPFDQFSDEIFKDKSRVHHQTYTKGSTKKKRGQDIHKEVNIDFMSSVKGTKINFQYERRNTCKTCNGNRCQSGSAPTRCLACGGSGSTIFRNGGIVLHLECERCKGIGLVIKNPCHDCKATGIKVSKVLETFQIPAGVSNGEKITFKQKGNQSQNGPSGDLNLKLNVERHPKFRKHQNNIESTEWLNVSEAVLGVIKTVDTIWGKMNITVNPGIQDGAKIRLKGQGIKKGIMEEGDHICLLRIKIPTSLTAKQRQIFQELAKEEISIPENQKHEQETQKKQKTTENAFGKFKDLFK